MNTSELRAERIRQNKNVKYMAKVIGKSEDAYAKKERGVVKFDPNEMVAMQQLRCLWTAYCLHHNLDVDTHEYDVKMDEMWQVMQENESAPYSSLEFGRFYNAMSKYLV